MVLDVYEDYDEYENDDYIDFDNESTQEAFYRIAEDNVRFLFGNYASINEDSFSVWDSGGYPGICCEFEMYIDQFATEVFNKYKNELFRKSSIEWFNFDADRDVECEVTVKRIGSYDVSVNVTDISGSDYDVNKMLDDGEFMYALEEKIREQVELKLENEDILSDAR